MQMQNTAKKIEERVPGVKVNVYPWRIDRNYMKKLGKPYSCRRNEGGYETDGRGISD